MKKIGTYIVFALIIALQACKPEEEPQGQSICASDEFQYLDNFVITNTTTSTAGHVDFTYAPYYIDLTARFNEEVSWVLTITGGTSGAVKTFTDFSAVVNVKWYGNADGDLFFQTGETCTISLVPACKSASTFNLIIDNSAIFDHYGYLLMDFDYLFPVYSYNSDVVGVDGYVRNIDTLLATPSPQGEKCRKLYAPQYHSGWYIGGFGNDTYDMSNFAGTTSSDSIFLNFYLKGNLSTVAMVSIKEQVNGTDYLFNHSIAINWTGWKFISLKLSDLSIGVPANIKNIDIQAGPGVYNVEAECYTDFVILTKGKPFNGPN